jgi:hypothetical protein
MTLDTPHFSTLDDALHDRSANPDADLQYTPTPQDRAALRVTAAAQSRRLDLVDDIVLTTFARLRNKEITDLRVAVLALGESWPPRRQWFQGYAAAHGLTL